MSNTNTATLMRSKGTRIVTPAELEVLPAPMPRGPRHRPIPHFDVVSALREEADRRSLTIVREEWALAKNDLRLFGVMEFDRSDDIGDGIVNRWSMGIRNSHDNSLALHGVAGTRTLVCDNLALSGEKFVLARKNTLHVRIVSLIKNAYDRYLLERERMSEGWRALAAASLTDEAAKAIILDAFTKHNVAAVKYLPPVVEEYFSSNGEHADTAPRSKAGLFGAFTRTFKDIKSRTVRWSASHKVGKVFAV